MTKDGTAEFIAVDARAAAIFDLIYPIGSVFATTGNAPARGTWEEIAKGRTLQGADSGHAVGTTIAAGLPNITGGSATVVFGNKMDITGGLAPDKDVWAGAFCTHVWNTNTFAASSSNTGNRYDGALRLDASKSNPIYGNSSTVQPPAYVVHFYRRTA